MPELAKDEDVLNLMRTRVEAGDTGLRSGKGFYPWPPERADEVIQRRNADLLPRRLAGFGRLFRAVTQLTAGHPQEGSAKNNTRPHGPTKGRKKEGGRN